MALLLSTLALDIGDYSVYVFLMKVSYNNYDDANDNQMDSMPQTMGEVVLCLKDRNTKT